MISKDFASSNVGYSAVFKKHFESTSIRGVPRIMKAQSIIWKIIWTSFVLAFFCTAMYYLKITIDSFFLFQTTFSSTVVENRKIEFPSISVCNLRGISDSSLTDLDNGVFNETTPSQYFSKLTSIHNNDATVNIDELKQMSFYYQNLKGADPSKLGQKKEDFIFNCIYTYLNGSKKYSLNCTNIQQFEHPQYWNCFTLRKASTSNKVVKVELILFLENEPRRNFLNNPDDEESQGSGVRLLLHNRDTYPNMDEGIDLYPGVSAKLRLDITTTSYLMAPYGNCDSRNLPEPVAMTQNYLETAERILYNYSTQSCIDLCTQDIIINNCNCRYSSLPINFDKYNNQSIDFCYKIDSNLSDNMDCLLTILDNVTASKDCRQCFTPCSAVTYDTQNNFANWPHPSYHIGIYKNWINDTNFMKLQPDLSIYEQLSKDTESSDLTIRQAAFQKLSSLNLITNSLIKITVLRENFIVTKLVQSPNLDTSRLLSTVGGLFIFGPASHLSQELRCSSYSTTLVFVAIANIVLVKQSKQILL